jgi:GNAT superfamily N-acetyltransferase
MVMSGETVPLDLPTLTQLVNVADAALHPWVRTHVGEPVRRAALEEELGFWLNTAARDLDYATSYAEAAPQSGEPPEAYLDRWLPLSENGHVLAGPRYLGRDPNLPFVGVSASDRPLTPHDRDALVDLARTSFRAFAPGFVLLTTADPIGTWPETGSELRQVVGLLGDLRAHDTPSQLTSRPRTNTDFYNTYRAIHHAQIERDPQHARHTRVEAEQDLQELAGKGLLHDVLVEGRWAGIVAGEPDSRRGVKGATIAELLLSPEHRGHGLGKHLSILLAKALPMDDDDCMMGTIHAENIRAYRAALSAGRIDVGGEIRITV